MRQRTAPARSSRRVAPPLEHRILMTATLCLIAYGAVMVYSASAPQGVVNGSGYGTSEFLMYLFAAGIGLIAMRVGERYGLRLLTPQLATLFVIGSTLLLLAGLVPGVGQDKGT